MLVAGHGTPSPWRPLIELPELAPGAQLIDVATTGSSAQDVDEMPAGRYFVFNCEFFVDASFLKAGFETAGLSPAPSYPAFVASYHVQYVKRIGPVKTATLPAMPAMPSASARSTLVTRARTTAGDRFWRVSAYENDRRITPDRQLVRGTYVTTDADVGFIASGLGAVGRYALPNPFPARYVFAVRPRRGTPVALGTVRPQYGQSGGGIEGVFDKSTGLWSVSNHVRALPAW